MGSSQQLYNRIAKTIEEVVTPKHIRHLTNLIWIVVGIVQQQSVAMSQIAQSIAGETQAESRVAKIRRWLKNSKIDVWTFYQPILCRVLKGWRGADITLTIDGTMVFGDRFQIFRLSLLHGCRAIPIGWKVIPGKGNTRVECLEGIFRQAAEFLQPRVRSVTLLGDRGFRDCDWAQLCLELGWNYIIRLTANTTVWLEQGLICRIDELGVRVGKPRFFQNVSVTLAEKVTANLSVTWTEDKKELLALISNKPANRARLRHYGLRMQIEESFRDDKSGGFDLEHTRLQHTDRIERLLLAAAIAAIWCHELGERCISKGDSVRRIIDPGRERELSLFQLGLRWLHRCLATAIKLIPRFLATLSPIKLNPVVKT
jgi:DDE family transposase